MSSLPLPIQPLTALPPLGPPGGGAQAAPGFGTMLEGAIGSLNQLELQAGQAGQALASGASQDVAQVVATTEKAGLALQLAVQLRNKAVQAYQQLMNMQV